MSDLLSQKCTVENWEMAFASAFYLGVAAVAQMWLTQGSMSENVESAVISIIQAAIFRRQGDAESARKLSEKIQLSTDDWPESLSIDRWRDRNFAINEGLAE